MKSPRRISNILIFALCAMITVTADTPPCDAIPDAETVEYDLPVMSKTVKFVGARPKVKIVRVPPNRSPKMKITSYSRVPMMVVENEEVFILFGPGAKPAETTFHFLGGGIPSAPKAPFDTTVVNDLYRGNLNSPVNVMINEVISSSVMDYSKQPPEQFTEFNGYPAKDSIELYNPTSDDVDLTGFYLIDDRADAASFIESAYLFQDGISIPAFGFHVVQEGDFAFGIGSGDNLRLFKMRAGQGATPDASLDQLIDFFDYTSSDLRGHQLSGGRCPDGSNNWVNPMKTPSLGLPNDCPYPVVVNEVLTNNPSSAWPDLPDQADYIELFNTHATEKFDLGGCYIIDDSDDGSNAFVLPSPTILEPKELLSFVNGEPDSFAFGIGDNDKIRVFKMTGATPSPAKDTFLFGIDMSDSQVFPEHQRSGGRCPDGSSVWVGGQNAESTTHVFDSFGNKLVVSGGSSALPAPYQLYPSKGAENCADGKLSVSRVSLLCDANNALYTPPPPPAQPPAPVPCTDAPEDGSSAAAGKVVLSEVDASGSPDYVELFNAGSDKVDMSGWTFKDDDDAHSYIVPAGTTIAAGAFLILECGDGVSTGFDFGLGGAMDAVRLWDQYCKGVLSFSWAEPAPTGQSWSDCAGEIVNTQCKTKRKANDCPMDPQECDDAPPLAPCDNCEPFPAAAPASKTATVANVGGILFEVSGGAWHPGWNKMVMVGDPGFLRIGSLTEGEFYVLGAIDSEGVAVVGPDSEMIYIVNEDDATIFEWSNVNKELTGRVFDLLNAAAAEGVDALTAQDKDALVDAGEYNIGSDGEGAEGLTYVPTSEGGEFWVASQENCYIYRFRVGLDSGSETIEEGSVHYLGKFNHWVDAVDLSSLEYDWKSGTVLAMFDTPNEMRVLCAQTGEVVAHYKDVPGADQEAVVYDGVARTLWLGEDTSNVVNEYDAVAFPRCPPAGRGDCAPIAIVTSIEQDLTGFTTLKFVGHVPKITRKRVPYGSKRRMIVTAYSATPTFDWEGSGIMVGFDKCVESTPLPAPKKLNPDGSFGVTLASSATKIVFQAGTFGDDDTNVRIVASEEELDTAVSPLPSASRLGTKVLRFWLSIIPVKPVRFLLQVLADDRRLETAFPVVHWLNQKTNEWQVVCNTFSSTEGAVSAVQADLAPSILAHEGFDPASGCDSALPKCESGDGGYIAAFYIDDKVCAEPEETGGPSQTHTSHMTQENASLIAEATVGTIIGVSAFCACMAGTFFFVRGKNDPKKETDRDIEVPAAEDKLASHADEECNKSVYYTPSSQPTFLSNPAPHPSATPGMPPLTPAFGSMAPMGAMLPLQPGMGYGISGLWTGRA